MLLIYCKKEAPRISYIFNLILKQLIGVYFEFCYDLEAFKKSSRPKLSYTTTKIEGALWIYSFDLLFHSDIYPPNPHYLDVKYHQDFSFFFSHNFTDSMLPFDIFSASFFLVSRYEEYYLSESDKHGRFPDDLNFLVKNKIHKKPLVNIWAQHFFKKLKDTYPYLKSTNEAQSYRFLPTIDIDSICAYKHKTLLWSTGAFVRDFIRFNSKGLKNRIKVLSGKQQDPFDNFSFQVELHKKYNVQPLYFFLIANKGIYNMRINPKNPHFINVIQQIDSNFDIGIHPGYHNNNFRAKMSKEKKVLEKIINKPILNSRQHFLKFRLPQTYESLIEEGITMDFSMGFSSTTGFRAGIADWFYFFHLRENKTTDLKIVPFYCMDATYIYHLKYRPEQALEDILELIKQTKKVGGLFTCIWHNESLYQSSNELSWRKVYEQVLKKASNNVFVC